MDLLAINNCHTVWRSARSSFEKQFRSPVGFGRLIERPLLWTRSAWRLPVLVVVAVRAELHKPPLQLRLFVSTVRKETAEGNTNATYTSAAYTVRCRLTYNFTGEPTVLAFCFSEQRRRSPPTGPRIWPSVQGARLCIPICRVGDSQLEFDLLTSAGAVAATYTAH